MSLPIVVGTAYRDDDTAVVSSSQGTDCPLPSGIADGDLLIYVVTSYTQPWSVTPNDSGAWTRLVPYTYSGTQTFDIFAATYSSSLDLAFFSNDVTLRRSTPAAIAIRDWTGNVGDIIIGSEGLRSTQGLDGYHTISPSLTTVQDDCLVLSSFVERTIATTNEPAGASVNVGTLDMAFFATVTIESIIFSHVSQTGAGASGDTTATYPNYQASNGIGLQIAIPGSIGAPPANAPVLLTGVGDMEEGDGNAIYVTSAAAAIPANVAVGDLLLILGYNSSSYAPVPDLAGCIQVTPTPAVGTYRELRAYVYPIPDQTTLDGLPSTITINSSGAGRMFALVGRITGADLSAPLDVAGAWNDPFNAADGFVPGIAGAQIDSLAILIGYSNSISSYPVVTDATASVMVKCGIWSADDGGVSSHSQLYLFDRGVNGDGSVPDTTFAPNQTISNLGGVMFTIAVGSALPPGGVQAAYKTAGGTQSGTLFAMTGSGPAMVTSAYDVPNGYATVSDMLSTPSFVVAHRGGSRSYPEMSLHAYTQSIVKKYGAIELSLARTSDGVWFGLHDATLDRTSGVTGVTASAITWSQVQTYNILGSNAADNPTQPDRPYMRWEELIAAYYPSHIIFVDPKAALSYRAELLTMMDALPGTPQDHFVAKYYGVEGGVSNTGWAKDAADHGYERWGYFYQADASNFATYQGRWSILGMDYNADQPTWDTILSYGKPVIGHICPNTTTVNTALTKGASGLMISGTASIDPTAI